MSPSRLADAEVLRPNGGMYLLDAQRTVTARRVSSRAVPSLIVAVNARSSGVAEPERLLAEVVAEVRAAGRRARGCITERESDLREVLAEAGAGRVVLAGGDGTLHAAVNAGQPLPEVALVPTGKANNVAWALGIPDDPRAAARLAIKGTARPLDVMRVETGSRTTHAVEGVSAGFQADARGRYSGESSGDLLAGVGALAATVRRYRPYRVELSLDRRPAFSGEAAQLFLSNLPLFGFGFRVDPVARVRDGLIEAIVAQAGSRRELLSLLAATYRGRHLTRAGVALRRARTAVIETPLPLVCDSTVLGRDIAEVSVIPGALRIVS